MPDAGSVIFRSPRRADCDERAFVLSAVGIASELTVDGADFLLVVSDADTAAAVAHLSQYEIELRQARARAGRPTPPPLYPNAWSGALIYAAVLVMVAYIAWNGVWRLDAFDNGELDAIQVRHGEWWRAWTALTLHVDTAHLLANTVSGIWFGVLAGRLLGAGMAWLLIVWGAGGANLLEAYFAPAGYRAVGASTAVFTALGLLSAYSWRTRRLYPQSWAKRWGPLVAGVVLLAWLGTGGGDAMTGQVDKEVDVVAHVLGFVSGALLGAGVGLVGRGLRSYSQLLLGAVAVAPILLSWALALR